MIYLCSRKITKSSSAAARAQCYFHSSTHQKIAHFTIFSSSKEFFNFRSNLKEKSLRNGKLYQGTNFVAENKSRVSVMVKKEHFINRKKPLWKEILLFGSKKFRSIILLNVICIIYASNIAVIKEVEAFTDPAYFSAVRFAVSTIPFLPFIFRARNDVWTRNSGLELGLWVSLGYLNEALGLLTAEAGRASFMSLFTVIVIPLLESILGEIVPARTWFGMFMSVLGISMLECGGSPPNIGDLFNFLSAIFFGIHTLRTKHISRTTKKENFLALLGYEVSVVAVISTIWCLIGANRDGNIQDSDGISWQWALFWDWIVAFPWVPALYTGVFSTGLCLWAEIVAMRDVSATETAVIYGLEPLWGAGFAWFLLGERWGIPGWIGAALVLGGSLTVQMLGASTCSGSRGDNRKEQENEALMLSNNKKLQKTLSASPVMVRSSRDSVMDILKK